MNDSRLSRALVIGTGLIGTSIALALTEKGVDVTLADRDPENLRAAARLGAGVAAEETDGPADLAVIAVPPSAVPRVLDDARRRGLARAYTDVASVKGRVVQTLRRGGRPGASHPAGRSALTDYVPSHPMAGSETSGPGQARADLFRGRPWVICPLPESAAAAIDAVRDLAVLTGAEVVEMDIEAHDRAVALISHSPHLVSSAVAGTLTRATPAAMRLAGRGIADVTRIAGGDPVLWSDILRHNAKNVAAALTDITAELTSIAAALELVGVGDQSSLDDVTRLLTRGRAGRQALLGEPAP